MQENNSMVCWVDDKIFCNFIEGVEDKESIKDILRMATLEEHKRSRGKETLAYVEDYEEDEFGPTFCLKG